MENGVLSKRIDAFLDAEINRYNKGYYSFESDVFKELRKDKEYLSKAEEVSKRFNKFQDSIREVFNVKDNTYDIRYMFINWTIARETDCTNDINHIVYKVIDELKILNTVIQSNELELDFKTNKITVK